MRHADLAQILAETEQRVFAGGSLPGDPYEAPQTLVPAAGLVRDDGLGTIGRGNHFVEVQVVEEIRDRHRAHAWGLRQGLCTLLVHSGSRKVGKAIGGGFAHRVRAAWPAGVKHPPSGIFALHRSHPLYERYRSAGATAANYGFVNRALLAELFRRRLRERFGADIEAPLVADIPHNLSQVETSVDGVQRWVCRKGASPAYEGQPVLIPGSMGASSYVLVGHGNHRFLRSASHGAGRATSRGRMGRSVRSADHLQALGLEGVECITLRDERRVQEAPAAYKPIDRVVDAQVNAGIGDVVALMRPLFTFKA